MYITDNKMFDSKFGGNKKRQNQIVYIMSDACVTYTNSEEKRN